MKAILDIDVYRSTMLKNGESQDSITQTFNNYHLLVEETFKKFNGEIWHRMGDGAIVLFPISEDAVSASLQLLNSLVEFNRKKNRLSLPLSVRIGIHETEEDIINVPKDKRGKYASTALDIAGKLQKNCPIGKIAISAEVYDKIGVLQRLFRPSLVKLQGKNFFVLIDRPIMPQEEELLYGLSREQKKVMPPIPFPVWDKIIPGQDINLAKLNEFLSEPLVVILGETSSDPTKSPISSAATSDAIGMIEVMGALRANFEIKAGIDEWEDTADLVSDRNVVLIGSGIVNIYAFALNDIFFPLHFVKTRGRIFDQIVATTAKEQLYFGPHGIPPRDCGLVIISKSPFNLEKILVWVAGITGMGTQAAAILMRELTRDPDGALRRKGVKDLNNPIACVVCPHIAEGPWEIRNYYKRWRISDYKILWAVDQQGRSVNLSRK